MEKAADVSATTTAGVSNTGDAATAAAADDDAPVISTFSGDGSPSSGEGEGSGESGSSKKRKRSPGNPKAKGRAATNLKTNCRTLQQRRQFIRPKISNHLDAAHTTFHYNGGCTLLYVVQDEEGRIYIQADAAHGRKILEDKQVLRKILESTPTPESVARRRQETPHERNDWGVVIKNLHEVAKEANIPVSLPRIVQSWQQNSLGEAVFAGHLEVQRQLPTEWMERTRRTETLPATSIVKTPCSSVTRSIYQAEQPLVVTGVAAAAAAASSSSSSSQLPSLAHENTYRNNNNHLVRRALEVWSIEHQKMMSKDMAFTPKQVYQHLRGIPHVCLWLNRQADEKLDMQGDALWAARVKTIDTCLRQQQQQQETGYQNMPDLF